MKRLLTYNSQKTKCTTLYRQQTSLYQVGIFGRCRKALLKANRFFGYVLPEHCTAWCRDLFVVVWATENLCKCTLTSWHTTDMTTKATVRMTLALGYWVLGDIHRYWILQLLGDIFSLWHPVWYRSENRTDFQISV